MPLDIRPFQSEDVETIVAFGIRAWKPVDDSFRQILGPIVYQKVYPNWVESQAEAISSVSSDPATEVWVAAADGALVGFVAVRLLDDEISGEIEMIAVDPEYQKQGIASALTAVALDYIRSSGRTIAAVATGGDPGHAPARHVYEKAGFTALPLVMYYRAL